jgi:hypothetical protein
MSAGRRIALIAVTVVLLAGGFVLARGAGTDEDVTATTPTPPAAAEPAPRAAGGEPSQDPAAVADEPERRPKPAPRVERVRMRDGAPAGEVRDLVFTDGETVRLRFSSNVADEVHIHGVDRYVDVPAGGSASTRFRAEGQGIFEIESHTTGTLVARLEIRP